MSKVGVFFSLKLLGSLSPDCGRLRGTILAAIPQSFIFTFLLENRNPGN